MFDCHGTLDLYCWDGGKTWVVDGEPQGEGKRTSGHRAGRRAARCGHAAGRGRASFRLVARELYRKAGVPDADAAVIFFHGLGLSHMDVEQTTADWRFEAGMVAPVHMLYPGGERAGVARGGRAHHRAGRRAVLRLGLRAAPRMSASNGKTPVLGHRGFRLPPTTGAAGYYLPTYLLLGSL